MSLSQTPIIAMTAYATDVEIERKKAAGFADYLTKPVTRETLIESIKNQLIVREIDT